MPQLRRTIFPRPGGFPRSRSRNLWHLWRLCTRLRRCGGPPRAILGAGKGPSGPRSLPKHRT
eukprot:scaffold228_cov312-Pinguiococcus_pyrenoidosus.AAC.10